MTPMLPTFAYFNSQYDWLIIAALVLLLFGGAKLPQLAKGLGEGIREFKKSVAPDATDDAKPVATADKPEEKAA